ncbi:uncharacterized protein LOC114543236 [Dendronephthya gigantea]|uniref:uncharacterized protein LOC114543236 n=1 Tax=Dendronephthya gigantea TaxID=151771 RepID=UPI00106A2114|nr:uncharacterized protein LOC114543236 [Dendronephthya gigantea]
MDNRTQTGKETPAGDGLNIFTTSMEVDETKTSSDTPVTPKSTLRSPFVYTEKKNRMLFKDYKLLDKFSPAVTNALEHNCLSQTQRSEFIRDICTDISSSGVYFLNKAERNQVALAIVTKYPHLKDSIGSGLGSWSESIKNRFKHVRKYASKKRKNSAMNDGDSETRDSSVHASNPSKPRKMDFWNIIPNPVGTESIQNDHLAEMQKECQKPRMAQDKNKIKELMNVTYDLRRKEILTTTVPVKEIIKKYPPLASVNGEDDNLHQEVRNSTFPRIIGVGENILKLDPYCKQQNFLTEILEGIKQP